VDGGRFWALVVNSWLGREGKRGEVARGKGKVTFFCGFFVERVGIVLAEGL